MDMIRLITSYSLLAIALLSQAAAQTTPPTFRLSIASIYGTDASRTAASTASAFTLGSGMSATTISGVTNLLRSEPVQLTLTLTHASADGVFPGAQRGYDIGVIATTNPNPPVSPATGQLLNVDALLFTTIDFIAGVGRPPVGGPVLGAQLAASGRTETYSLTFHADRIATPTLPASFDPTSGNDQTVYLQLIAFDRARFLSGELMSSDLLWSNAVAFRVVNPDSAANSGTLGISLDSAPTRAPMAGEIDGFIPSGSGSFSPYVAPDVFVDLPASAISTSAPGFPETRAGGRIVVVQGQNFPFQTRWNNRLVAGAESFFPTISVERLDQHPVGLADGNSGIGSSGEWMQGATVVKILSRTEMVVRLPSIPSSMGGSVEVPFASREQVGPASMSIANGIGVTPAGSGVPSPVIANALRYRHGTPNDRDDTVTAVDPAMPHAEGRVAPAPTPATAGLGEIVLEGTRLYPGAYIEMRGPLAPSTPLGPAMTAATEPIVGNAANPGEATFRPLVADFDPMAANAGATRVTLNSEMGGGRLATCAGVYQLQVFNGDDLPSEGVFLNIRLGDLEPQRADHSTSPVASLGLNPLFTAAAAGSGAVNAFSPDWSAFDRKHWTWDPSAAGFTVAVSGSDFIATETSGTALDPSPWLTSRFVDLPAPSPQPASAGPMMLRAGQGTWAQLTHVDSGLGVSSTTASSPTSFDATFLPLEAFPTTAGLQRSMGEIELSIHSPACAAADGAPAPALSSTVRASSGTAQPGTGILLRDDTRPGLTEFYPSTILRTVRFEGDQTEPPSADNDYIELRGTNFFANGLATPSTVIPGGFAQEFFESGVNQPYTTNDSVLVPTKIGVPAVLFVRTTALSSGIAASTTHPLFAFSPHVELESDGRLLAHLPDIRVPAGQANQRLDYQIFVINPDGRFGTLANQRFVFQGESLVSGGATDTLNPSRLRSYLAETSSVLSGSGTVRPDVLVVRNPSPERDRSDDPWGGTFAGGTAPSYDYVFLFNTAPDGSDRRVHRFLDINVPPTLSRTFLGQASPSAVASLSLDSWGRAGGQEASGDLPLVPLVADGLTGTGTDIRVIFKAASFEVSGGSGARQIQFFADQASSPATTTVLNEPLHLLAERRATFGAYLDLDGDSFLHDDLSDPSQGTRGNAWDFVGTGTNVPLYWASNQILGVVPPAGAGSGGRGGGPLANGSNLGGIAPVSGGDPRLARITPNGFAGALPASLSASLVSVPGAVGRTSPSGAPGSGSVSSPQFWPGQVGPSVPLAPLNQMAWSAGGSAGHASAGAASDRTGVTAASGGAALSNALLTSATASIAPSFVGLAMDASMILNEGAGLLGTATTASMLTDPQAATSGLIYGGIGGGGGGGVLGFRNNTFTGDYRCGGRGGNGGGAALLLANDEWLSVAGAAYLIGGGDGRSGFRYTQDTNTEGGGGGGGGSGGMMVLFAGQGVAFWVQGSGTGLIAAALGDGAVPVASLTSRLRGEGLEQFSSAFPSQTLPFAGTVAPTAGQIIDLSGGLGGPSTRPYDAPGPDGGQGRWRIAASGRVKASQNGTNGWLPALLRFQAQGGLIGASPVPSTAVPTLSTAAPLVKGSFLSLTDAILGTSVNPPIPSAGSAGFFTQWPQ